MPIKRFGSTPSTNAASLSDPLPSNAFKNLPAGFEGLALSPAASEILARVKPSPRAAVLLGAEGPGLAPDLMARARAVGIPMAKGFDSLNVATTSGIVLHHLRFAEA